MGDRKFPTPVPANQVRPEPPPAPPWSPAEMMYHAAMSAHITKAPVREVECWVIGNRSSGLIHKTYGWYETEAAAQAMCAPFERPVRMQGKVVLE